MRIGIVLLGLLLGVFGLQAHVHAAPVQRAHVAQSNPCGGYSGTTCNETPTAAHSTASVTVPGTNGKLTINFKNTGNKPSVDSVFQVTKPAGIPPAPCPSGSTATYFTIHVKGGHIAKITYTNTGSGTVYRYNFAKGKWEVIKPTYGLYPGDLYAYC